MLGYKGIFTPKNTEKYIGNVNNIQYRSLWERACMEHFDKHPKILRWASEEIIIPYWDEINQKQRRYFVDFYLEVKMENGSIQKMLVEIKPDKQQMLPKKRRNTKRYLEEVSTFAINQAKWAAADIFAAKHNMIFERWGETILRKLGIKIL